MSATVHRPRVAGSSNGQPPLPRTSSSPTGLDESQVLALSDDEIRALHVWHAGKAGNDDGRPWWPHAIRRLPLDVRLRLASEPELDATWEAAELSFVRRSPRYLLLAYGHMQDEEGGGLPVPFVPWPEQLTVMSLMEVELRLLILKARQLGLTWLALHYAIWLMGYNPLTPRAKILALSKTLVDAQKLLKRARRIESLFPPFLRIAEDVETRKSNNSFKLEGRGQMDSLPGTPDAARSEQADLVLADEVAFYRNRSFGQTWRAVQSVAGERGQVFAISTGNGPAEAPSDGQEFAVLWNRARSGEAHMATVFLPASTDPKRTAAWRVTQQATYLNPEDFESEHPETEEQALAGVAGTKVYLPAGVNAAEALGRELDELLDEGRLQEPVGGLIQVCSDWGESTHMLALWPLEAGGVYVLPAEYAPVQGPGVEPGESTRAFLGGVRDCQRVREPSGMRDPWPLIGPPRYDSAGVQSMRTFLATVEQDPMLARQFNVRVIRGVPRVPTVSVSFADYKGIGKDYLRYLFRRTARGFATGVVAISPKCVVLLRQLRGLELMEDGSGRIKKGDDHGPDAFIAGIMPTALRFLGREEIGERDLTSG